MKRKIMIILIVVASYILVIGLFNIRNYEKFHNWLGTGFLISIILAIIFSGAAVSGDRIRANISSETKSDRQDRIKVTEILLYSSLVLGGLWLLLKQMIG